MTPPLSCPTCLQQNLTSTLQDLGNTTTLLGFHPFHDAQGRSHSHNPNRVGKSLLCSNHHRFYIAVPHTCWCGWIQENK